MEFTLYQELHFFNRIKLFNVTIITASERFCKSAPVKWPSFFMLRGWGHFYRHVFNASETCSMLCVAPSAPETDRSPADSYHDCIVAVRRGGGGVIPYRQVNCRDFYV
jgi:hypothetical protein